MHTHTSMHQGSSLCCFLSWIESSMQCEVHTFKLLQSLFVNWIVVSAKGCYVFSQACVWCQPSARHEVGVWIVTEKTSSSSQTSFGDSGRFVTAHLVKQMPLYKSNCHFQSTLKHCTTNLAKYATSTCTKHTCTTQEFFSEKMNHNVKNLSVRCRLQNTPSWSIITHYLKNFWNYLRAAAPEIFGHTRLLCLHVTV